MGENKKSRKHRPKYRCTCAVRTHNAKNFSQHCAGRRGKNHTVIRGVEIKRAELKNPGGRRGGKP